MEEFKFECGVHTKDLVSGFQGVVVSRTQHLTGCNRYCIQSKSKDGKPGDHQYVDENALKLIKKSPIKIETDKVSGGPNEYEENRSSQQ